MNTFMRNFTTGLFFIFLSIATFAQTPSVPSEHEPSPDEFTPVEKAPEVDLAELQRKVKYPDMAIRAGIQGRVVVQVLIDKEGKPVRSQIVNSASPLLNKAATDAVMASTYKPAIQSGKPILCWISIPVTFKLRDGESVEENNPAADIARLTRLIAYDQANRSDYLYERGKIFYEMGEYDRAELDYNASNTKKERYEEIFLKRVNQPITDSSIAEQWAGRALLFEKSHLPAKAIEDYTRALTINPNLSTAYKQRALNYMRLKQFSPAVVDLKAFLKTSPEDASAHEQITRAYIKLGKTEQAQQYLEKAMKLHPDNAALYYLSALVHLAANDYETAKVLYLGAIAMKQQPTTRNEAFRDLRDLFNAGAQSDNVQRIIKEVFQM